MRVPEYVGMNPEWFAGRLRELRQQKTLSREQLAKAAGMTVGGIRDLEQGVRKPSLPSLIALCEALGESCDALLAQPGGADVPAPAAGRPRKASAEGDGDKPKREPKTMARKRKMK